MDAFCYFVDHASNNMELFIGSINFLLFFILLPLVLIGLCLYLIIKSGIKNQKEVMKFMEKLDNENNKD